MERKGLEEQKIKEAPTEMTPEWQFYCDLDGDHRLLTKSYWLQLVSSKFEEQAGRVRNGDRHAQGDQPPRVMSTQVRRAQLPWQNGTDESFNGRLRDECLNQEWFRSQQEARVLIENRRRH